MAGNKIHVFDFLDADLATRPVCVLFGDEPFLRGLALAKLRRQLAGDGELFESSFPADVAWRDVHDEVSTLSLFGGDNPRFVVVDEADAFVTEHRARLEDYVKQNKHHGVLVLLMEKFAGNTRLFKAVNAAGLPIECRAPTAGGKRVDQRRVNKWLIARTKHHHLANLDSAAATLLVELQGLEFGLLDQELAKLALFAGQGGKIDVEMVRDVVGGWKGKTIWELVDSALDGDAADALKQLDRLLQSGEHPYALFGQLAWALRRFAAAAHCFEAAERSGKRPNLQDALLQAGFQNWNVGPAERQIKRLGRRRARKIYRWLLELDLSLKGTHSADDRARFALESLFLQLQSLPA